MQPSAGEVSAILGPSGAGKVSAAISGADF